MLTKLFASTIICGPPSRTYSTLVTSLSRCSNSMLYMLCSFGLNNSLLPAKCPLEGVSPNYTVSACLGNFGSKILFGMTNSILLVFAGLVHAQIFTSVVHFEPWKRMFMHLLAILGENLP